MVSFRIPFGPLSAVLGPMGEAEAPPEKVLSRKGNDKCALTLKKTGEEYVYCDMNWSNDLQGKRGFYMRKHHLTFYSPKQFTIAYFQYKNWPY